MNMIEKVARVLSPNSWQVVETKCDTKACKKRREVSLDYAKRCIEAMREPTEEMLRAYINGGTYGSLFDYQMMIDAALKEDQMEVEWIIACISIGIGVLLIASIWGMCVVFGRIEY